MVTNQGRAIAPLIYKFGRAIVVNSHIFLLPVTKIAETHLLRATCERSFFRTAVKECLDEVKNYFTLDGVLRRVRTSTSTRFEATSILFALHAYFPGSGSKVDRFDPHRFK